MDSTPTVELDQLIEEGALAAPHLDRIKDILEADIHEDEMAQRLRDYMRENVTTIEDAAAVSDMLSACHIISKYFFRKLYEWRGCTYERL
jgi:hypothetical protein